MTTGRRLPISIARGTVALAAVIAVSIVGSPLAHAEPIFGIQESQWRTLTGSKATAVMQGTSDWKNIPAFCFEVRQNRSNPRYAMYSTKRYNPQEPDCPVVEPYASGLLERKAGAWSYLGSRGGLYLTCDQLVSKAPYAILSQLGCFGGATVNVPFASKLKLSPYPDCTKVSRLLRNPDWYMRGCTDGRYGAWGLWKVKDGKIVDKTSLFSRALSSQDCGASLLKAPGRVKSDFYFKLFVDSLGPSQTWQYADCGSAEWLGSR